MKCPKCGSKTVFKADHNRKEYGGSHLRPTIFIHPRYMCMNCDYKFDTRPCGLFEKIGMKPIAQMDFKY